MAEHSLPSAPAAPAVGPRTHSPERKESTSELSPSDTNKRERVLITHIRAIDVVSGLRRLPVAFYVTVEIDGKTMKTSNQSTLIGKDIVEWDEEILLPQERSFAISFKVYASFGFGLRLGDGELLRQFETTVGDVIDCSCGQLQHNFPVDRDELLISCSSLSVLTKRRFCDSEEPVTMLDLPESDATSQLVQLMDVGHHALLQYRQLHGQPDLDEAISRFEHARSICPPDHPSYSVVLCNLATVRLIRGRANNNDQDLDMSIMLYRGALHRYPCNHLDHCATVLSLGFALLARFQRREIEADGTDAKDMLSKVVGLSPLKGHAYRAACLALQMVSFSFQTVQSRISQTDNVGFDEQESIRKARATLLDFRDDDARRPAFLAYLERLLCRRFRASNDPDDVHEAILMLQKATQLAPDEHPNKPAWLASLGESLARQSLRLGTLADMNKSISMFEEALRLTPNEHEIKPSLLSNLAASLLHRFERLNDPSDINMAISMFEEAVHLAPHGNPHKPAFLENLCSSLSLRFDRNGNNADINKAISTREEMVHLTPAGHPDEPVRLEKLASSLLHRFEHFGDLADIKKAVSTREKVVRLTPNCDPKKPAYLNNLGSSLSCRFHRLGNIADINRSISMMEEAVHLTPLGHPDMPVRLSCLGDMLTLRFRSLGDLMDINKSISLNEEAVSLTPDGHFNRPTCLSNLGTSLLTRFACLEDIVDINKSISIHEEAVHLTPDGHPSLPARLNSLSNSLLCRFDLLKDLADINKAISTRENAVHLTPSGHHDMPMQLNNFGVALFLRFRQLGDLADIDKSISVTEEAVRLTPLDHPNRPAWLSNLGDSLYRRFQVIDDPMDINKSILMNDEAVSLTPDGHPYKPDRLTNLGNSLLSRFLCLRDAVDIHRSILMKEEALRLTPEGYPARLARLNNLGNSLLGRFKHFGDIEDVNKSILMLEEAVRLTPVNHPHKWTFLHTLTLSFSLRFNHLRDLSDIDKCMSISEEALRLIPNGHPNELNLLNKLGDVFMQHFKHTHDSSSLSAAARYFSLASHAFTGPASRRFHSAHRWISCARLGGDSQATLDAYATTIDLLPQMAWLGLPLRERHRVLPQADYIARDAAAAALEAGCPEKAIEWLEQGRSIVWGQLLQLRTPVDELRAKHADLADQLQHISHELDLASGRDNETFMLTNDLAANTRSPEEEIQKHHKLALMREKLLSQIRSLPGFDRFLLPMIVKQLAALAYPGPVVYLNASEQRCDALILTGEPENVLTVPFSNICYHRIELVQRILRLLLERNRLVISCDDISALVTPEGAASQELLNQLLVGDGTESKDVSRAVKEKQQRIATHTPEGLFQQILAYLWNTVVNPVLVALGFSTLPSNVEKKPRILWCPTGPFSFMPIHAAGLYDTAEVGTKLSDLAISSYVPTLGVLGSSVQKDSNSPSSDVCLITVPQPRTDGLNRLVYVEEEIRHIRTLSATSTFVNIQESPNGTVEDVMEKMKNADWVHFACHGIQDPRNPLDSGLCLADQRRLKLSDIIRLSRPQGGLAFLSACQTAQGDRKLVEESVHLAVGMLLAGYGGVIATMWAIRDPDAPRITKDVYGHLLRDGKVPDVREAAEALHHAVERLRDSGASFFSWVPYIHVGR